MVGISVLTSGIFTAVAYSPTEKISWELVCPLKTRIIPFDGDRT